MNDLVTWRERRRYHVRFVCDRCRQERDLLIDGICEACAAALDDPDMSA